MPITDLTADITWIRNHVILLVLAALLAFGAVYEFDNLISKHAADNDKKWQSILAVQQQQTSAVQSQLNLDEEKWAAINVQLMNANQKLAAAISSRDSALAATLKVDATLTAQQTAAKLGGTTNGSDITLPLPVGRGIAVSLDTLAGTQADLADTKIRLVNETTIAENLQSNLNEQEKLLAAMKTQSVDQTKACQAEVASVKSAARKGKIKAFFYGWVTGIVSARLLGI